MKLFYWLTTSVIKVYGWHFFQACCFVLSQRSFIVMWPCLLIRVFHECRCGCLKSRLADGAIIFCETPGSGKNSCCRSIHWDAMFHHHPKCTYSRAAVKLQPTYIHSSLTTLWILWHISRALSSLSSTKTLIIGLIAMAIFISLVILWWLHFVFNTRLLL